MSRVFVYDTTLRDGSQGEGVNFSLQDKLLITARLDDLGFDFVEGGYPLSNPKDADYFRAVRDLPLQHARVTAFGMTRKKNTDAAHDAGLAALLAGETSHVTLVGKTSRFHVTEVLGASPAENLRMIEDSVRHCRDAGRTVVYDAEHFFDGHRADPEYALDTLRAATAGGASTLVLCDTNGGTLPEAVAEVVRATRAAVPGEYGIHGHDDAGLAVANTLAAVRAGVMQVQGTVNGVGERCGNVDLVAVVANLRLKYGLQALGADSLCRLTELSRYVAELANLPPRAGQPFVGRSAFAHKGGMHTHAVAKDPTTYEHIDPAAVGNERRVLVGELSGHSTIVTKTAKLAIADRAVLAKVLAAVQDLEYAGYEFEAAEASFDLLVKKAAGTYRPWFDRLAYRVNIEQAGDAPAVTEATVKVRVGSSVEHTVSEGDGPVNALDAALRKALCRHFPALAGLELVDYKVRVVNARAGTAARVRVVVESRAGGRVFGTVGVSENVVAASWAALCDAVEYTLHQHPAPGSGP